MEYVLLTILILLYVSQNFFCTRYAAHTKTTESLSSFIYTFYLGIFLAVMTFIYNGFKFSASWITVALAVTAAVMLVCYYLGMVTASRIGSYMLLMIFMLFGGIIVPAIVDCVITRTMLSARQIIGVILMLIAIVLYNIEIKPQSADPAEPAQKQSRATKIKCYFYYILLFISNGAYGALLTAQQRLEGGAHEKEMLILTYIFAAALCIVAALFMKGRKPIKEELAVGKKATLMFAIAAVSATAAVNLLQVVLKMIDPTVVFTIDNGGNIFFAALLSFLIFKEKFTVNKIIGSVIIFASIIVLCV